MATGPLPATANCTVVPSSRVARPSRCSTSHIVRYFEPSSTKAPVRPGDDGRETGGTGLVIKTEILAIPLFAQVTDDAADNVEIEREGFFGELALLVPGSPRVARVRAKTAARALVVPRQT